MTSNSNVQTLSLEIINDAIGALSAAIGAGFQNVGLLPDGQMNVTLDDVAALANVDVVLGAKVDAIDAALAANVAVLSAADAALGARIDAANATSAAAFANVAALVSSDANLLARIDAANAAGTAALAANVAVLSARLDAANAATVAGFANVSAGASSDANLSARLDAANAAVAANVSVLTSADAVLGARIHAANAASAAALAANVAVLNAADAALGARIDAANAAVAANANVLSAELGSRIDAANAAGAAALAANVAVLNAADAVLGAKVDAANAALEANVSVLSAADAALGARMDAANVAGAAALAANVSVLSAADANLSAMLNAANAAVAANVIALSAADAALGARIDAANVASANALATAIANIGAGGGSGTTISGGNVSSTLFPSVNNVYDLGSVTRRWRNMYLSGNAISFGDGVAFDTFNWTQLLNYVVPTLPNTQAPLTDIPVTRYIGVNSPGAEHNGYVAGGSLYMYGRNDSGQLGLGDTVNRNAPTIVGGISNVVSVACGQGFTAALLANGALYTVGKNFNGQLGLGTTVDCNTFQQVPSVGNTFAEIACGVSHLMVRLANGAVVTCGSNARGQLGNGNVSASAQTTLVPMTLPSPGQGEAANLYQARAIAAGGYHSAVCLNSGACYLCGDNTYGQLGVPAANVALSSTLGLLSGQSNVVFATAGENHTAVVKYDGSVLGFGRNDAGQLGQNNKTVVNGPVVMMTAAGNVKPDAGLTTWVGAGASHTVISTYTNEIRVCGTNAQGQLGVGAAMTEILTPTVVGYPFGWKASCTRNTTSFVSVDGTNRIQSCGDDTYGQVGEAGIVGNAATIWFFVKLYENGAIRYSVTPTVSTSTSSSGWIDSDGTLYASGANGGYAIGDGTTTNRTLAKPNSYFGNARIVQACLGDNHNLALDSLGRVWSWGSNGAGQLGDGTTTTRTTPVLVSTASGLSSLSNRFVVAIALNAGNMGCMALDSTGALHAWGSNTFGQLGSGNTTNQPYPVLVSTSGVLSGRSIVKVACSWGSVSSFAVDSLGAVYSWGQQASGSLGDNLVTASQTTVPVRVSTTNGVSSLFNRVVIDISSGYIHALVLDRSGNVHAWGANGSGQLGDNSTTQRNAPVLVNTTNGTSALFGKTVVAISAGYLHSLAIDSSGAMYAWGSGTNGQLGDNTATNRSAPVAVQMTGSSSLLNNKVVGILGMINSTLAIDANGGIHTWGVNSSGQLGLGDTTNRLIPNKVTQYLRDTHTRYTSEGYGDHKLFMNRYLATAGVANRVDAVGNNAFAQLGDGTTANTNNNVMSTFGANVVATSASTSHSGVVLSNGTVWLWGRNNQGQCGQSNTSLNVAVPTQVSGISNAKDLALGNEFTLIVLSDQTVYAVGSNANGKLGIPSVSGNTTTYQVVAGLTTVAQVACGAEFAAARTANGAVYTWGTNASGATGQGTTSGSTSAPTPLDQSWFGGTAVSHISAGAAHLVACCTPAAALYTCGDNSQGQLGRSTGANSFDARFGPVPSWGPPCRPLRSACGPSHTVVLLANETMVGFGSNASGQLGANPSPNTWSPVTFVSSLREVLNVAAGNTATFYERLTHPFIRGIGQNDVSVALSSFRNLSTSNTKYTIDGTSYNGPCGYSSSTTLYTNVIDVSGRLFSCGFGGNGRLGDGLSTNSFVLKLASAVNSAAGASALVAIAGGSDGGLAITSSGTVIAWGDNSSGQLANGTTGAGPLINTNLGPVCSAISSGSVHNALLTTSGQVVTCGYNGYGGLGDGTGTNRSTLVAVATGMKAIACGQYQTYAIHTNNTVYGWGKGDNGFALTSATSASSVTSPTILTQGALSSAGNLVAIAAGQNHVLVLSQAGIVYAWGLNGFGQVGEGTTTNRGVPSAVMTGALSTAGIKIVQIACGFYHSLALDSTGKVYAVGYNSEGQCGDNSTTARSLWVAVNTTAGISSLFNRTVVSIGTGQYHCFALDSTGALHVWGYNNTGQLGDATTTNRLVPVRAAWYTSAVSTANTYFINFTGQHRCFVTNLTSTDQIRAHEGLIVVADRNKYVSASNDALRTGKGAITVNDSLPFVSLSSKAYDKRSFGVISLYPNDQTSKATFDDLGRLAAKGDVRAEINSLGEGGIWIVDENGSIESGDYITTSSVPGYGMRQDADGLKNYTVAKATMDCDFEPAMHAVVEVKKDEYGNNVLDGSGMPVWEPVHGETTETAYQTRYVASDGMPLTKEEYDAVLAEGGKAYRAAFIGCTYHCG